jgi:hypothetical protein
VRLGRPEQAIQKAVIKHLRARGLPDTVFFHVGNGGARRPIEAKVLRGLGVLAGVPDLLCRKGRAFALELKTERGRVSEAQGDMLDRLDRAGED